MALATRNLYLVLKARDEASRVVRGFGRELTRASQLAQADALRSRAAMALQRAAYLESIGAATADVNAQRQLAQQLTAQAQALERSRRRAVAFANALQTVSSSVITIGSGLAIGGAAGLAFLASSIHVARDYEQQVRRTATQVDNFSASLEDLSKVGLDVAKNIAVPFEDIQPALYNILSSTNANLEQATILLNAFAKTAVAGQVSIEDAARGTIPILNAFNLPLEDVNRILDIQFQLVRKGVGTYGEFASVFGRVVPSATRAGQTFEEVAAMLAYLTRNGLSAAMAASASARALDALSHPKAVENLENMGIKVRDLAGNFLPLEQILTGLREKLNQLPQADRVAALVEVFKGAGGTIQARRFLEQVLLRPGELEEFIGFLGDMKDSSGAFQNAYETMAQSVANQTILLRNKWKVLQETVGKIMMPIFARFIMILQKVLDWFNNLSPSAQRFIVIGIALASAFGVVAGIALVLLGILASIAAAVITAGAGFFYLIGALAAVVVGLGAVAAAFIYAWNKSEQFRGLLGDIKETLLKLWNEAVEPTAEAIRAAWEEKVVPALERLKQVLEEDILPVVRQLYQTFQEKVLPAAKEVGNFIKDELSVAFTTIQRIIDENVIPALERAKKFYEDHKETIDKVIAVVVWLGKEFAKLAAFMGGALFIAFAGALLLSMMVFVETLMAIAAAVNWVIDRFRDLKEWMKNLRQSIVDTVQDFPDLLYNAGRELIAGLIRGIESKIGIGPGTIGSAMGAVVNFARGFLPGSPAKWGPLAGQGSMYYAGQEMVKQLAAGISSMQSAIALPGAGMAGIGSALLQSPTGPGMGRTFNQSITVNTQEISPVRQSAELGFLLAGRM